MNEPIMHAGDREPGPGDGEARELSTGFVPSRHGFAFANTWEDRIFSIDLGERDFTFAFRGRCGGMAFAALDYFRRGESALDVAERALPDNSSAIARYIMRRQIESHTTGLASNLRRFALEVVSPSGTPYGTGARTRDELGNILVSMVAGNPVPLGLVTADRLGVGLNHQVVAYGVIKTAEALRVRIYDPNLPRRDDVELIVTWTGTGAVSHVVGGAERKRWRGLFVERYAPRTPPMLSR